MKQEFSQFNRRFFNPGIDFQIIGDGELGGKGAGLAFMRDILARRMTPEITKGIEVGIPKLALVTTTFFDSFMEQNKLYDLDFDGMSDARISMAFQRAELPPALVGDLMSITNEVKQPLAVRSSSLLEDRLHAPFAGIYGTKMIPNNNYDPRQRFADLVKAVKFVYASAFLKPAREYLRAVRRERSEEKMAVVVQEVIGLRHGDRFYPNMSVVGRSFNYYPFGPSQPEEGVADLAFGLGRTIVDDGVSWSVCPAYPRVGPPYTTGQLFKETQLSFWAINMGKPPEYDPTKETEFLVREDVSSAEPDGSLELVASTYDPQSDRFRPGTGLAGPRVLNFAPLLVHSALPVNDLLRELLAVCRDEVGSAVEAEFAMTWEEAGRSPRLGFLQVRPMMAGGEKVEITDDEANAPGVVIRADRALGNGAASGLTDIVYLKPEAFSLAETRNIAGEVAAMNRGLMDAGRPYVLIGFGRWGSSDSWLGVPVEWPDIAGAKVIVESALEGVNVDLSQGSHFFHNLCSFRAFYLTVRAGAGFIDWGWLGAQTAAEEGRFARHITLEKPLTARVDGRTGRGVVGR